MLLRVSPSLFPCQQCQPFIVPELLNRWATQLCLQRRNALKLWSLDDHPLQGFAEESPSLFLIIGAGQQSISEDLNLGDQVPLKLFCPELSRLGNTVNFSGAR